MKVTLTDINPTKVLINVDSDVNDLAPLKKHVLSHFATKVKVPGFRSGKAPHHLIEKHVDPTLFTNEFLEHAINEFYQKAVGSQKIRPVGQPSISIKKFVPYTQLEFGAEQEVVGTVKLANYKAIKMTEPKVEVTATDIADIIKRMQTRMAEKIVSEKPIKNGDETIIDFFGSDAKGEPIAGAEGIDYPLVIGSNTFIPGFEDELIGLKNGDKKEFKITFPADYQASDLRNKEVTFKITIKEVKELIDPKVDEAFAAKVGPFKSVAELKADIKKQLLEEKKYQAQREFETNLIKKISEKSEVDVPESLIEEQVVKAEDEEKRNLMYRGQTWAEHLKLEGVTEEQHRERNRPEAIERVKASLVLSEISEIEKVDITAAEIEARVDELKTQYTDPAMQAELDKPENRQDIAARILTEKTLAKLKAYATKA